MPNSTPEASLQSFAQGLQNVVTCLAPGKIEISRRTPNGNLRCYAVLNRQRPTRLSCDFPVWFLATHVFRPAYDAESGAWTVATTAYYYAFQRRAEGKSELLAFHWHPEDEGAFVTPHLHVGQAGLGAGAGFSSRWHVPTGRIVLEDVIRFAIGQLGARPVKKDWEASLERLRTEFTDQRTRP